MSSYERALKKVLRDWNSGEPRSLPIKELAIKRADVNVLQGLGLVTVFYPISQNMTVRPTDDAFVYFLKKKEKRREFWADHVLNFTSGVAVGVVSTLLTAYLTKLL